MKYSALFLALVACVGPQGEDPALSRPQIIPQPVSLRENVGQFELRKSTRIRAAADARATAEFLRDALIPHRSLEITEDDGTQVNGALTLRIVESVGTETPGAYRLLVDESGVLIQAADEPGLFYGVQTLLQLCPQEVFSPNNSETRHWKIAAVEITDEPRFPWRGIHLDVGRHYMPTEFVKKCIDLAAMHKLNVFHWHLTEDQGWRLEVDRYPELTEISAWREQTVIGKNTGKYDGIRHGGFYTKSEVREIVEYAAKRHITVIPEIEMPGHSRAVLAAYPNLSCTGGPFAVKTNWGVEPEVYCAGNDETIVFLENVLEEVLELFPSEFIHIGGDECPKQRWKECAKCQARIRKEGLSDEHELQSWVIRHFDRFLQERGRRLIGWDEILEGGLASGAAVMSWRGESGGIRAAQEGHDVVMAPTSHTYLDYYQSRDTENEPPAIGGFLPLSRVYEYDPIPAELDASNRNHVLGAQGQLWTEYMKTPDHVEYMAFPRACALAEVVWSPRANRDYGDFLGRLRVHLQRLDALDVNYRELTPESHPVAVWKSGETTESWSEREWSVELGPSSQGPCDLTFQYTAGAHRLDIRWAELQLSDGSRIRDEHEGRTGGSNSANTYTFDLPALSSRQAMTLRALVRSDGGNDSAGEITAKFRER